MTNQTLQNSQEVIQKSPVQETFPTAYVDQGLFLSEMTVFLNWLGMDFRQDLIDDLVDYSGAVKWVRGTAYALDAQVIHKGVVYISLTADNNLPPTDRSAWKVGDKFQESDYQTLWDYALGLHLALEAIKPALTFTTYEADSGGVMVKTEENSGRMTASTGNFSSYVKQVETQINKSKELVILYICEALQDDQRKDFYKNTSFQKWDSWQQINGLNPANTQRRWISYRY